MKGVVVDIKGKYAVVLTGDGSFVKVKSRSGLAVGREADFQEAPQFDARVVSRFVSIAAAFAVVMFLGLGAYRLPYSYVNVDINPSLMLTSNLLDRVIKVEALNEDARKLLLSKHLENMGVGEAVDEFIEEAEAGGYIGENDTNAVLVSVSSENAAKASKLEKVLEENTSSSFTSKDGEPLVVVEKYSMKEHRDAKGIGMSPAKLALISELLDQNSGLKLEDLKSSSVKSLMKAIKEIRKEDKDKDKDKDKHKDKAGTAGSDGNTSETQAASVANDGENGKIEDSSEPEISTGESEGTKDTGKGKPASPKKGAGNIISSGAEEDREDQDKTGESTFRTRDKKDPDEDNTVKDKGGKGKSKDKSGSDAAVKSNNRNDNGKTSSEISGGSDRETDDSGTVKSDESSSTEDDKDDGAGNNMNGHANGNNNSNSNNNNSNNNNSNDNGNSNGNSNSSNSGSGNGGKPDKN